MFFSKTFDELHTCLLPTPLYSPLSFTHFNLHTWVICIRRADTGHARHVRPYQLGAARSPPPLAAARPAGRRRGSPARSPSAAPRCRGTGRRAAAARARVGPPPRPAPTSPQKTSLGGTGQILQEASHKRCFGKNVGLFSAVLANCGQEKGTARSRTPRARSRRRAAPRVRGRRSSASPSGAPARGRRGSRRPSLEKSNDLLSFSRNH